MRVLIVEDDIPTPLFTSERRTPDFETYYEDQHAEPSGDVDDKNRGREMARHQDRTPDPSQHAHSSMVFAHGT